MRRFAFLVWMLAPAAAVLAQPVIQTIFGGAPDGLPPTSASLNSPSAITFDANGVMYIGLRQAHQVVKIANGLVSIVAGSGVNGNTGDGGPAKQAALGQPSGLAVDKAGNLYIADAANNVVRRVNAVDGTIVTVAGNGKSAYAGDNGPAVKASLKQPSALLVDLSGNLYIADTSNHAIRRVGADGNITLYAGTGNGNQSAGGDENLATKAGLYSPQGLAIDSTGVIYIADTGNGRIRYVTTDGYIHLLAGRGGAGFTGDGGSPLNALFNYPTTLSVDQSDQLYINDQGNYRIRRIQTDGRLYPFAGTGIKGAEGDQGYGKAANINAASIAVDLKNNVFLVDADNDRVRQIRASDGIIDTVAGTGAANYNPLYMMRNGNTLVFSDGNNQRVRQADLSSGGVLTITGTGSGNFTGDAASAQAATVHNPRGFAFDKAGNLYLADSANHRIRKIDTSGNINTFAGTGTASSTGDGGTAINATLNEPVDVVYDSSSDSLFVAERSGQIIRQLSVSGSSVKTVAGTGTSGPPDSETGVALNQNLSLPQALFLEAAGTLLIADSGNHRVRRLTPNGTITTIAGTGTGGFGGDNGPAVLALLRGPIGLAKDDAGNLYIADSDNSAIRQVGSDGIITTVAGLTATGATRLGGFNGDGAPATNYQLNRPYGLVQAAASCSVLVADSSNGRIRQVTAGVTYNVNTDPPGLQITVDGGAPIATPAAVSMSVGTSHTFDAPAIQDTGNGMRYLETAPVTGSPLTCGTPRQSVTVKLSTQYQLTVTPDAGGSVSAADQWQAASTQLTLTAKPDDGYVFTGWEGDCSGTDACQVTMDGPKNILAHFAPKS